MRRTTGDQETFWIQSTQQSSHGALDSDLSVDVAVIGGGIAGLSVAYRLAREGVRVAVLERGDIGSGETGRTTAHLSWAMDEGLSALRKRHGDDGARRIVESHRAAVDAIERTADEEGIACDFQRLPGFLFGDEERLREEHRAYEELGFPVERARLDLPERSVPALRFPDQARFHPIMYLQGLAEAVVRHGGIVHTGTEATLDGESVRVGKRTVRSRHVAVATNVPITEEDAKVYAKQVPMRTYVCAYAVPDGAFPDALVWDTEDPYHYVRLQPAGDGMLLIAGGCDHRPGEADTEERFARLDDWARRELGVRELSYRWSGMVIEPVDGPAFIGRTEGETFIVTGDSGQGMTHGTIAGMLIPDLMAGRENPWAGIYDPHRKPARAAGKLLAAQANPVKNYAKKPFLKDPALLGIGEGGVFSGDTAAFRDDRGELHVMSAKCTHMGCTVSWNASERIFDCGCHGSRFSCTGAVLNGPANTSLPPQEGKESEFPSETAQT